MNDDNITYRLAARTSGTVVFGLHIEQLAILGSGGLVAVIVTVRSASTVGLVAALVIAVGAVSGAFVPWRARPIYEAVPVVARYVLQRARKQHRWVAPIPFTTVTGTRQSSSIPPCFEGIEIIAADRPTWAGTDCGPVAYIRDKDASTLTAVVTVRGREFALLDESDQHQRISSWGRILGQFAREGSAVARISWYEHCVTGAVVDAPASNTTSAAADSYRALLTATAPTVATHETHVTITVDLTKITRNSDDGTETLELSLRTLMNRLRDAGLDVTNPPNPRELIALVRRHADPYTTPPSTTSFASALGYVDTLDGLPIAIEHNWDHLRADNAWHRSYWVSNWPTLDVGPRWLEPLLLDGTATRTLCVIMEPIAIRRSRRRLNVDAVRIQGDVSNRERHGLRVPFHLQRAHDDLDRRERELQSGYAEYRYLALITVTSNNRDDLDAASRAILDNASQCGIEPRALDLRHDAAWACTLPIGRAPRRSITDGIFT